MRALLICSNPFPEQPKTGIMFGKCELCATEIIYHPLNLERVKQLHGEDKVQIACMACFLNFFLVEVAD